jgi:hypothetical protein
VPRSRSLSARPHRPYDEPGQEEIAPSHRGALGVGTASSLHENGAAGTSAARPVPISVLRRPRYIGFVPTRHAPVSAERRLNPPMLRSCGPERQ